MRIFFKIFFLTIFFIKNELFATTWTQIEHPDKGLFYFTSIKSNPDSAKKVGDYITYTVTVKKDGGNDPSGSFIPHYDNCGSKSAGKEGGNCETYLSYVSGDQKQSISLPNGASKTFMIRTKVDKVINNEVRLQISVGGADGFSTANIITPIKSEIPLKIVKTEFSFKEGAQGEKPEYTLTLRFNRPIKSSDITGDNPTISYQTKDATAVSTLDPNEAKFQRKIDYYEKHGYKVFKVGDQEMQIPIQFLGDRFFENDEYFYIDLTSSNLKGENLDSDIKVTIQNDDTLYIGVESKDKINESDAKNGKKLAFTIATDAVVPKGHGDVKVCYKTRDYTESGAPATAGADYEAKEGCVTIKEGDANTKTEITVFDDNIYEYTEYFAVDLTSAEGGEIYDAYKEGIGTILDDDPKEKDPDIKDSGSYIIMDKDESTTLKTAVLGKVKTIKIKAVGHKPVTYIRQRQDCNTCSGCGSWYDYQYGLRYGEGNYYSKVEKKDNLKVKQKSHYANLPKYIVTDKRLKTKLVSCGCGGGGGGGGGGGCGAGCSPPCSDYTNYRDIPDSSDYMNVAHIYLDGYDNVSCSGIPEVTDLLNGKAFQIRDQEVKEFKFVPTKMYRCAKIRVEGYSDTPYYDHNFRYMYRGDSTDAFAIRPDRFEVEGFDYTDKNPLIASKKVNFTIKAVMADGTPTKKYNQNIISNKTLFYIKDKIYSKGKYDEDSVLPYGFKINQKFKDGIANIITSYKEVGELSFVVKETKDDAFAMIDKNDESSDLLLIKPSKEITFRVIPDHFDIKYTNFVKNDITLIANEINDMSRTITFDIEAKNINDDYTTTRYEKGGYSYDTNLSIYNYIKTQEKSNLSLISNLKNIKKFTPISYKNGSSKTSVITSFDISANDFDKGVLKNNILLNNFERSKNKPLEPIELHTSKVKIIETNGIKNHLVSGENKDDTKNKFYYAKIHVPSPQSVAGNSMDVNYYYEVYCKNCDKDYFPHTKNRASIDDVYWYILPSNVYNYLNGCNYTFKRFAVGQNGIKHNDLSNDKQKITIDKPPYEDRVYYSSKDYLLFDKYNKNITEHYFDIKFTPKKAIWAGEGEKGSTVDTQINQVGNPSIEW